ncbi:MAG: cation transporter [Erysipelotrichaceae bacterium]|nr:cation transporter [Erysipelotrichaceae bacterium]
MDTLKKTGFKVSIIGIIVNTILCVIKLIIGHYSKSIAIVTDGFDNLSDVGNSLMILVAYRLASKPADKDHPYGHGRIENMLSQAISLMIMSVGVTLLISSVKRILDPQTLIQDDRIILMIIVSILIKLGLAYYYYRIYASTKLNSIKAQVSDSLSDTARNLVIIVSYAITLFTGWNLDGYIGVIVSVMIIFNGFRLFSETSSILVGKTGDDSLIDEISNILSGQKQILGVHDLRIHSYGPMINYASADVEIDGDLNFMKVHDLLDTLEEQIRNETGVIITLHGDPVSNDQRTRRLREIIKETISLYDGVSYHDLHYNESLSCYHVDLSIPYAYDLKKNDIVKQISDAIHEYEKEIDIQINVDRH